MQEAFHHGGWGMFPTLLFGVILNVAAIQFARQPSRPRLRLVKSLGLLTVLAGLLGFTAGCIKSFTSLGSYEGPDGHIVALIGVGESANNLGFAMAMLVVAAIAVSIGVARAGKPPVAATGRADLTDPLAP
jgi:hypothetical protein